MEAVKSFFSEERDPLYRRGVEKGMEKERARAYTEKLRSARKMKENGIDHKVIADVLDLPIADIDKL